MGAHRVGGGRAEAAELDTASAARPQPVAGIVLGGCRWTLLLVNHTRENGGEMSDRAIGIITTGGVWGSVALIVAFSHQFHAGAGALRWAGLVLVAGGAALLMWGGVSLGGVVSGTFTPRALITTGAYARFGHPMYLGGALCLAGLALYVESAAGLIATVAVAWPCYWWSAALENRRLREKYGSDYDAYRRQVWL